MTTAERRNFFRVNQDIIFEYHCVDIHSLEQKEPESFFDDDSSMEMINQLRKIDKEAQTLLKVISDKQRLLSDYLQRLNSKIDLIARHSIFAASKENQTHRLNLSEGGIAFESTRALYKGNFVVIRLIFLPSYTPVLTFAKVIRCESSENSHKVAAKFHNLKDNERQILARQVLKAQVTHRKQQQKLENPKK